jgi:hypothetical protein
VNRQLNKRTFFLSVPLLIPSDDTLTNFLFLFFLRRLRLCNLCVIIGCNLLLTEKQGHVRLCLNKHIVVLPGINYYYKFGVH